VPRRIDAVQNAAARLVTGTRRRDHITPVLRQLHWLPVRQRVHFKLAVLVFKALHAAYPCYLVDDCQLVTDAGRRRLRLSEAVIVYFIVNRPTSTRFGDRAFGVSGPSVWNSLPTELRQSDLSFGQFRRALKRFGFNRFCGA